MQQNNIHSKSIESLNRLDDWIQENGWAGWDPYDIKGYKKVIELASKAERNKPALITREVIYELFYHFPVTSRKILGITKQINPKAMALFASGYLSLFESTGTNQYFDKAQYCLDWLLKNSTTDVTGLAWGYPFDWQSKELITANTPNGIVTTAAADSLWRFYKHTKEQYYLEHCARVCKFLSELPVDSIDNDRICFSYTSLYINHVHNLNLFIAEFLIKISLETNTKTWSVLGEKALNYTLSCQREDGSFDYNGPPEEPLNFVDNYHTGFVLRMLHSLWILTGRKDVYNALDRGVRHYTRYFFEDQTIPKLLPDRKYRIDIHSCAESINCLCELSINFPQYSILTENILNWTIDHLQDDSGFFYYGILKSRFHGFPFISKVPYIRWSQAWMLKALSEYISMQTRRTK